MFIISKLAKSSDPKNLVVKAAVESGYFIAMIIAGLLVTVMVKVVAGQYGATHLGH